MKIELASGEKVQVGGRGGWLYNLIGTEEGADLEVVNPAEDGGEKFFVFSTVGNPFGAGKIVQERTLGVQSIEGRIIGALVVGEDGKIKERFSWSNIVFFKKKTFSVSAGGELTVDGASKGFLAALFLADKNRIDGFVGIFKPMRPDTVKVLEMEDLLLASI